MLDGGKYLLFEVLPVVEPELSMVSTPSPPIFPSLLNDDLSAFGSSITFSWPDCLSGTRFRGWLSMMKILSYLTLFCLKSISTLPKLLSNPFEQHKLTEVSLGYLRHAFPRETDVMSLESTPATEKRNMRVCVKSLQIK
jgi:hypothetical protein